MPQMKPTKWVKDTTLMTRSELLRLLSQKLDCEQSSLTFLFEKQHEPHDLEIPDFREILNKTVG